MNVLFLQIKMIFNRSAWLYLMIIVVLGFSVDQEKVISKHGRYLLGIFYNQELKNFKDGIVYFDYLIKVKPYEPRNYFFMGYCYLQLSFYDKARGYFQRALSISPGHTLWAQYLLYTESKIAKDGKEISLPTDPIIIPME